MKDSRGWPGVTGPYLFTKKFLCLTAAAPPSRILPKAGTREAGSSHPGTKPFAKASYLLFCFLMGFWKRKRERKEERGERWW